MDLIHEFTNSPIHQFVNYRGHGPVTGCTLMTRNSGIVGGAGVPAAARGSVAAAAVGAGDTTVPMTSTRRPIHDVMSAPVKRYPSMLDAELPAGAVPLAVAAAAIGSVVPAVPGVLVVPDVPTAPGVVPDVPTAPGIPRVPVVPAPIVAEPTSMVPSVPVVPAVVAGDDGGSGVGS